jgi:hypothetical protein
VRRWRADHNVTFMEMKSGMLLTGPKLTSSIYSPCLLADHVASIILPAARRYTL